MAAPMVELVPMTAEEFQAFLEQTTVSYAADHVRAGNWSADESLGKSRAELKGLLPNGLETADHFLRLIAAGPKRTRVGTLWYAVRRQAGRTDLFVYWIGIDEPFRRHGYAAEAFRELDHEAVNVGAGQVLLHVFGDNVSAIALYEKLGFATTNRLMARVVRPPSSPGT
jgi:ribosomal protein S18 acetylase RimI-like enzyme